MDNLPTAPKIPARGNDSTQDNASNAGARLGSYEKVIYHAEGSANSVPRGPENGS